MCNLTWIDGSLLFLACTTEKSCKFLCSGKFFGIVLLYFVLLFEFDSDTCLLILTRDCVSQCPGHEAGSIEVNYKLRQCQCSILEKYVIRTSGNFRTSLANFHSLGWSSSIVVSWAAFANASGLTLAVRAMDLEMYTYNII